MRIEAGAHHGYVDVCRVERKLAEIGHGENAQPGAHDGLAVSQRAIRKSEPGLEIFLVELSQPGTETHAAGELDGCAGKCAINRHTTERRIRRCGRAASYAAARNAGIDALEKTWTWLVSAGNDDASVAHVEGRQLI